MPANNPNFTGICFFPVLRIRIHMFLGLPDPDSDPLVGGLDPDLNPALDPDPDPPLDPDPALDPCPLLRGMASRMRMWIRIHPKMSWIRNTGCIAPA